MVGAGHGLPTPAELVAQRGERAQYELMMRDRAIVAMRAAGASFAAIGRAAGLSPRGVQLIVRRMTERGT